MLIARFSALGDVAMTIPVVYSLCRAYPDVHFVMATQPAAATLFIEQPSNLTVKGVDVKTAYRGFAGLWRLAGELDKESHFDAFADLHGVLRTDVLRLYFRLRGIAVGKIDKGRREKRQLTQPKNKQLVPLTSSHERYRRVFAALGFDFPTTFVSLFEKPVDPAEYAQITRPKQSGETWIAVAPFAKHKGKTYPSGLMSLVIERLAKRQHTRIFLFGGAGHEQEVLQHWTVSYPNVISLAGKKYGFPKELSLLSNVDVMVSMDSANMHLASLVAVPVVSAEEMNEAVHREAPGADVFVSVAAVADWRAQAVADEKIKKSDEPPALDLVENPDILAQAAREFPSLYCVGFAAETENVLENARGKRIRKLARMIVANNARSAIGCDMNEAVIVMADKEIATGHVSKDKLAQTIIECIAEDLAKEV